MPSSIRSSRLIAIRILLNLGGSIGQGIARGEPWAFVQAGPVLAAFVVLFKTHWLVAAVVAGASIAFLSAV
jgi:hypothetical protein